MVNPPEITNVVHRHIVALLKADPDYSTFLPGGIWKGVAPNKAGYPHLVMVYTSGMDHMAFAGQYVGSGLEYLLKVIDASPSETKAVASFEWLENVLMENNGSNATGEANVYFDYLRPFNLPDVQDDVTYQQVGRSYTVFVDPTGF
jgi:hypothetical protein